MRELQNSRGAMNIYKRRIKKLQVIKGSYRIIGKIVGKIFKYI